MDSSSGGCAIEIAASALQDSSQILTLEQRTPALPRILERQIIVDMNPRECGLSGLDRLLSREDEARRGQGLSTELEIIFQPKKKWERIEAPLEDHFGALIGTSPSMKTVFAMLAKLSPTDLSCILMGETGTGKELAARAIHERSRRHDKPFVVVDCGAISEHLIESELSAAPSRARTGSELARSKRPMAGRCFSTRLESFRSTYSRSCCASSSAASFGGWARCGSSKSMFVSSPRRIVT